MGEVHPVVVGEVHQEVWDLVQDRGKIVYDGFHKVEELEIDIKGKKRKIERLGINHAVAGIICDADNKIALVVQYRPCVDEVMYEIPAGLKY